MGAKVALRVFRKNDECQFSKTNAKSSKKTYGFPVVLVGFLGESIACEKAEHQN
jgi:hypothetical protein